MRSFNLDVSDVSTVLGRKNLIAIATKHPNERLTWQLSCTMKDVIMHYWRQEQGMSKALTKTTSARIEPPAIFAPDRATANASSSCFTANIRNPNTRRAYTGPLSSSPSSASEIKSASFLRSSRFISRPILTCCACQDVVRVRALCCAPCR